MTDKPSLLPANVSDLERDLEVALARIEDVQIPIATLWDPWKCPLEVLPFLAWALSVDMWRSDWPEITKRRIVATSKSIHRVKGTRPAVENAINGIYEGCQLTEWFESTPSAKPGTFTVDAFVSDQGIDQAVVKDLSRSIDEAKRKSAHYTLRVILSSMGEHGVAFAGLSAPTATIEPYTVRELMASGETLVAFGLVGSNNTTVEALA